jgi:hypothetical protein
MARWVEDSTLLTSKLSGNVQTLEPLPFGALNLPKIPYLPDILANGQTAFNVVVSAFRNEGSCQRGCGRGVELDNRFSHRMAPRPDGNSA